MSRCAETRGKMSQLNGERREEELTDGCGWLFFSLLVAQSFP